ncbi:hypothetical protein IQ266_22685 [filamentous cyanobacterium LEGE 11480]|uniref:Transposase n=1 Tax=Romeriopsis navalis LEGE 11480 TaxID=2777977 RepID=A0A928VQB5_9CYAN|nr:hypothetical protein [Romeriopsis navalis]MBE9032550.1 hypothetical protein [Romeriopsis navalis LEGE 11480]
MRSPEQLDDFLDEQLYAVMPAGMYRFWEISNPEARPAEARLLAYLSNREEIPYCNQSRFDRLQTALLNCQLHPVKDWPTLCQVKFAEWSQFRQPPDTPPSTIAKFNQLKDEFCTDLPQHLTHAGLRGTAANISDLVGARLIFQQLHQQRHWLKRLFLIYNDGTYRGAALVQSAFDKYRCILEAVLRKANVKGFRVLPKRWMVERTFA